ncbi:response regulator [Phenylobacterium sp.]|jgi:CheY-like chemotaxis protein|uniref:response regulator n=1 Tax=Phenylobacterium sp. TaxID=1871053 RepID=UPI002F9350E4
MNLAAAKILLVEDNRKMADLVRAVLNGLGVAHLAHLETAPAALQALDSAAFDLILLDRHLGEVDGLDLARQIRRHRRAAVAETPIVMLTGSASAESVRAARDAGVNGYLVKPFTVVAVHERLVATLSHRPPFIRSATYIGPDRRRRRDPAFTGAERRRAGRASAR